jgi:hypothetical protein
MSTALIPPPDAEAIVDLESSTFSMEYRKPRYPISILLPYSDGFRGPVVASLLYFAKHLDLGFELVGNTLISNARNELADRFLKSKSEWSFWIDSDVFVPFGNKGAFLAYTGAKKGQNFAEYNALTQLLSRNHPLVGGVYAGRFKGAPLTIQPDLAPRNPNDQRVAEAIREGRKAGGLQAVDWVAAGLMLVHRKVFEKIIESQPMGKEWLGPWYPFFTQFESTRGGEDIAFCDRARKAGIQPMLDTDVRAGHIGLGIWTTEDSKPVIPMRGAQPPALVK